MSYSKEMDFAESSNEILDAQAHVWNYIFKFINTMSLKCAIELGIADIIHKHGKPITLAQLVDALSISRAKSQHIFRLMRILVHSSIFTKVVIIISNEEEEEEEEEEAYWLTNASRLLLKDEALCMVPFLRVIVDPIMQEPWHHVSEWLSCDGHHHAPFDMAYGARFWEYTERVPRLNHMFNEAMASDSGLVTHVVLRACRDVLEGFESLVDVGGGTGAMAKAIAQGFPQMKCMVLDLPHVVAGLEGTKNLTYIGGDMFEAIPPAHIVFLKSILHDWNDTDCVRILKKCKDAIGGKVIIIDMILNNHDEGNKVMEDHLFYDMAMMTYLNGKERSEKEWANIFSDAGFTGYKIRLGLGVRSLIELYP